MCLNIPTKLKNVYIFNLSAHTPVLPMAESFVAVCDMLLKFHNLSAKFVCSFNE